MLWTFFDKYWLWLTIPLFVVIIMTSHEIGYRMGVAVRTRQPDVKDESLGDLTGSAFGLLGLILAFSFGWSASRYDALRMGRLEEAQAITELYRLADLLPAQEHSRLQALLLDYIAASLDGEGTLSQHSDNARRHTGSCGRSRQPPRGRARRRRSGRRFSMRQRKC